MIVGYGQPFYRRLGSTRRNDLHAGKFLIPVFIFD